MYGTMGSKEVKISIFGDIGVGKTSVVTRFVKNELYDEFFDDVCVLLMCFLYLMIYIYYII